MNPEKELLWSLWALGKGRLPSSSISLNLLPLCEQALLACESGVSHDASSGIACFMSGV